MVPARLAETMAAAGFSRKTCAYERNTDNATRTEYIKGIFNNDYTQLTLSNGRIVGYKTFQNVLHLWEGKYENIIFLTCFYSLPVSV